MRRLFGFGSVVALGVSLGQLAACGGDQPDSNVDRGGSEAHSNGGDFVLGGSMSSVGGAAGGASSTGGSSPIEECAAANQQAELAPVYLVFLLDESGSMGDGEYGNRVEKWDPVTAALKAFFADPESTGITASLSLFPLNKNKTMGPADEDTPPDCSASAYVTPAVLPTALPDDKVFADAIVAIDPPNEFGTPTFPALSGTIDYAKSVLAEDATRKVAIVMVTDGNPVSCQGNTIQNTAAAAAAIADQIPTYVIGVGDSLEALNSIAEGGGTEKAFIVSLDDPEQTRKDLLETINLIRGQAISCEIDVPAPPVGKRLDPEKVDVQFTANGKPGVSLKYGTECTGDTAWRYDDATAPKTIELCADTCTTVKADAKGKLNVVFGCVKRQVVN